MAAVHGVSLTCETLYHINMLAMSSLNNKQQICMIEKNIYFRNKKTEPAS